MHDIFISYSTKDQVQAETVRNVLENNGIPCWMAPRDIPGGSNYTKEIPIAIRSCQVFVLILSQNSQNSHWVLKELDSAVNCGKVILPFMLEDCQLNDEFNFLLTGAQRYAAYQKKADALEALISRIRAVTGNADSQPVRPAAPAPAPAAAPEHQEEQTYLGLTRCPACGSGDLVELTKKIGRFTFGEKLTALIAPVAAIVGALVLMVLVNFVLVFLPVTGDVYMTADLLSILAGLVGGWILGGRMAREWVRRQRVRKHICQHPFRCVACRKEFLAEQV